MKNKKRIFIIHSLKLQSEAEKLERDLEELCYIPGRDTPQTNGQDILRANYFAMRDSKCRVYVIWDGQSQGTLFDMGMAYALDKEIMPFILTKGRSWVSYFEMNLKNPIRFRI